MSPPTVVGLSPLAHLHRPIVIPPSESNTYIRAHSWFLFFPRVWTNTEGKDRFTVVSTCDTVHACIAFTNFYIIYLYYNCNPTFALRCMLRHGPSVMGPCRAAVPPAAREPHTLLSFALRPGQRLVLSALWRWAILTGGQCYLTVVFKSKMFEGRASQTCPLVVLASSTSLPVPARPQSEAEFYLIR